MWEHLQLLAFLIIFLYSEIFHNLIRTIYQVVFSYTKVHVYHNKPINFVDGVLLVDVLFITLTWFSTTVRC